MTIQSLILGFKGLKLMFLEVPVIVAVRSLTI